MSLDDPHASGGSDSIKRRHLRAASQHISTRKRRLFIDGEWRECASRQTFKTHDPTTGDVLAEIQAGAETDVDRAVEAAWDAYRNRWAESSAAERQRILNTIADRVEANHEKYAILDTLDNGKPITESRTDIDLFVDHFRYFAGACRFHDGSNIRSQGNRRIQTTKEPYGVVGQIIPWNFPMLMTAWKLAPALAAGNTVVLKPAEETPLSVLELMREVEDVIPSGVVNVVTGSGPEAGSPLVTHEDIRKIAFTGSTEVGKGVMKRAAVNITDVTLELGGKSPVVVYPDVDVGKAVDVTTRAMFFNNGECCSAGTRLFVHEDIEDEFMPAFIEAVEALEIGDPLLEETDLGPQITPSQANKTMQYLGSLREDDVEILTGGYEPDEEPLRQGCYVAPTVVSETDHDAQAVQEEIFGPVEVVFSWSDYDRLVECVNDVSYGLAAGVITDDIDRAYRTADDLDVGNVWVNTYNRFPAGQPFGGTKESGIGREVAAETLDEYTQTKTMTLELDDHDEQL
ncbi:MULTISPECIES: aldehyde dehydrogenase family protein [Salinibaculum]|uniref:aldehyde dehydrogenase family protein n=1 Tax=Salinibaculum TaxID=2732368 RepID=UPI0030D0B0FC